MLFKGKLHKTQAEIPHGHEHKVQTVQKEYVPPTFEHHAPKDKRFHMAGGKVVSSIGELAHAIPSLPEDMFETHVNENENHFADWIEEVFGLQRLADTLRQTKEKQLITAILTMYKAYAKT